jgi:hypothetical protein
MQLAVGYRLVYATAWDDIFTVAQNLGAESLEIEASIEAAESREVPAFPDDQWIKDVKIWHAICMTQMAKTLLDWVAGPPRSEWNQYLAQPSTPEDRQLCLLQKSRNLQYYNFSMLGLLTIILTGIAIIFSRLALPRLIASLQKRFRRGEHAFAAWNMAEALQLHRITFESAKCES